MPPSENPPRIIHKLQRLENRIQDTLKMIGVTPQEVSFIQNKTQQQESEDVKLTPSLEDKRIIN